MIELKNISKKYINESGENLVLKDINLKINKGQLIAITGPSGSGKSTLINIIGLMDSYSNGEYLYNETLIDINKDEHNKIAYMRNKCFGFIYQNFALIDNLTVMENIKLPIRYRCRHEKIKFNNKINEDKIKKELKKFQLEDKLNSYPYQLSGGQQQRVSIIRAIINDAEIIIADEPTGALDIEMSLCIFNELENLNKEGKTIIIVTHDLDIAKRCKIIISLRDGHIQENRD